MQRRLEITVGTIDELRIFKMECDKDNWRTQNFREKIISQIDEAIRQSGNPINKNSAEMENHVFVKAKSKDEYLSYVARLILHVRELSAANRQALQGMVQTGNLGIGNSTQPDVGLQNPISALQSLARQDMPRPFLPGPVPGSQLQGMQMAGHGPPPNGSSQVSQNPQLQAALASPSPLQQQQQQQQMPMSQQQGPPQGLQTFGGNIVSQGKPRMGDMMVAGVANPRQMQMTKVNVKQHAAAAAAAQKSMQAALHTSNKQAAQAQLAQQSPDGMMMHSQVPGGGGGGPYSQGPSPGPVPRQGTPTQFLSQSPGMAAMHNPMTPSGGAQSTTPVGYMPSPNSQIVPSPSLGPISSQAVRTPSTTGLPSPGGGSALNTPASMVSAPSPSSRALEDQAYLEKVKQLSKYIEPLSRMIARIDKDESAYDKKKDLNKMKNLLDILSNPAKRLPMDTLLKCEQVLEKLDLKVKSTESSGSIPPLVPGPCKEQNMCQPLLDAVVYHIKSPVLNHTLQRTFGPAMGALYGPPLRSPSPTSVPPAKRKKTDEEAGDISDVLQGEIARLDQRFKVNLDPIQHCSSRTVHLVCQLDDKSLPCVPPITVTVPEHYPKKPPKCDTSSDEYESTPFLQAVQKTLIARMSQMPDNFSITSLLDTWEMSVRQACSPGCLVSSTTDY